MCIKVLRIKAPVIVQMIAVEIEMIAVAAAVAAVIAMTTARMSGTVRTSRPRMATMMMAIVMSLMLEACVPSCRTLSERRVDSWLRLYTLSRTVSDQL